MTTERTGGATSRSGRPFRAAWSLAAGWCGTPRARALWALLGAMLAVEIVRLLLAPYLSRRVQGWIDDPPALFVLAALIGSIHLARELRRRLGARRRRRQGGAAWWRDRDWPADGVDRRVFVGIRGPDVWIAGSVVATFAICAGVLSYVGRLPSMYSRPELFGWVPAPAYVIVATYALPLAWFALVFVPRLGRGRLLVSWPTFPQFSGGRCAFHVATSPGGATIDGVSVFLRCIRVRHRPLLPLATWNSRLVWVAEARLPLNAHVGPETHLRAEFDVPADAPSTDLHADDAVRWEVLVLGTVGGADYADAVDVPVYRPT